MRIIIIFMASGFLFSGCRNANEAKETGNLNVANKFIDAFYSFDKDSLNTLLSKTDDSKQSILYYQGWAECGNYKIIDRHKCIVKNDSFILCPVTVKDDLIGALKINFNVTDTFHLTIIDGEICSIQTSSNDPEQYYLAKDWIKQYMPELIEKPCEGIWEDGTTPCECVKAMIKGYTEYINKIKENKSN